MCRWRLRRRHCFGFLIVCPLFARLRWNLLRVGLLLLDISEWRLLVGRWWVLSPFRVILCHYCLWRRRRWLGRTWVVFGFAGWLFGSRMIQTLFRTPTIETIPLGCLTDACFVRTNWFWWASTARIALSLCVGWKFDPKSFRAGEIKNRLVWFLHHSPMFAHDWLKRGFCWSESFLFRCFMCVLSLFLSGRGG